MRTKSLAAMAALSLLATPVALAAWGGQGSWEPDTADDRTDGWMYPNPDLVPTNAPTKVRQVYFNAFMGVYPLQPTNTNVGTAKTGVHSQDYRTYALLGVWKDCNKDGYVGFGDNGLFEYRVELLQGDTSVCKVESYEEDSSRRIKWDSMPVHNDGQWVHEFLPISWNRADAQKLGDVNPFDINSNGTRIWGDFDRGEPVSADDADGSCPLNPQPTGTYHSTGGLVWFADCSLGWTATDTFNDLAAGRLLPSLVPGAPETPDLDEAGAGQVSFDDKPREQYASSSILNVKNPWGEESDDSFVEMWDCSQAPVTSQKVSDTQYVNVSTPRAVPGVSASGSPAGTANSTASGLDECNRSTSNNGNSHYGQSVSTLPYANEGDSTSTPRKTTPQEWLAPYAQALGSENARPSAPWATLLGRGTPGNFGVSQVDPLVGFGFTPSAFWVGRTNWAGEGTLSGYQTYYAFIPPGDVSKYSLRLPKGGSLGSYGSAACSNGFGPGKTQNGWECDPAKWFKDSKGEDVEPRSGYLGKDPSRRDLACDSVGDGPGCYGFGTRVGALYNMRDVDCYDSSADGLRQLGVTGPPVVTTGIGNFDPNDPLNTLPSPSADVFSCER